jgi:hypothetical protein
MYEFTAVSEFIAGFESITEKVAVAAYRLLSKRLRLIRKEQEIIPL